MAEKKRIKKSLKVSFLDGIFASIMTGMTTDYITPYALALKASVRQIGILNALPNFFAALMQLKSPDFTELQGSRKKVIVSFVLLHALMAVPIILIPYLFQDNAVTYLIIFVTFFTAFNAFAGPAWASLMSDYIPPKMRGRYFGWRNKMLGIVTIIAAFSAGTILQLFKKDILKGFLVIFIIAFVSRLISWWFLTKMYEPPLRITKEDYFSFWDFIRRFHQSNFLKFVIFVAGLHFSVNVAAPFFSVFMLRDLKFNYLTYTVLVTTVTVAHIFTIDRWGRHADHFGNLKILKFTSLFIASLPLWWIINHNPIYLIFIQILSGFAWSGFNLCAVNFIYDAVKPEKRTRCIAYFNFFSGVATCLGAVLGGYLANILPQIFSYRLLSLFFLSSILRFSVVFFISRKIKEVRIVEKIKSKDLLFSIIGIKPALDFNN
ncbi:MAG: MFS transporter [Candidatus Omnitrophica bacterium]|nr:MFS transporter [Candidatus Omnitrophota bacterium]